MIFSSHDLLEPIRQAILVTRTSYSAVPLARAAHPVPLTAHGVPDQELCACVQSRGPSGSLQLCTATAA